MGHIRDQSPLQRALQTLLRGAASGAGQFPQFQAGQADIARREEESRLSREFRGRQEGRAVRGLELREAGFAEGVRGRAQAFTEAERAKEAGEVSRRRIGRGDFGLEDIVQSGLTTGTRGALSQKLLGLQKPPKPPKAPVTPFQRIGLTDRVIDEQQTNMFANLQSLLEDKGIKFGSGDKDKRGFVLIEALRKAAQTFADEEVDRPGIGTGDFPRDSSLIQLFNQAQGLEGQREGFSQNLGQFFPSLRQTGQTSRPPARQMSLSEIDAEIKKTEEDLAKQR